MPDFKAGDYRLANEERQSDYSVPSTRANQDAQLIENQRATHAGVVSFLSSNEREGRWQLPRRFRALAVFRNVEPDFRGAEIGYGMLLIEAGATAGELAVKRCPAV